MDGATYLALDGIAAFLTATVAAFFLLAWRRTREERHVLLACGFAFLAAGFLVVSASALDLARDAVASDGLRMGTHTGGALVILFAYLGGGESRRTNVWRALAWASGLTAALFAGIYVLLPPFAPLPSLDGQLAVAHTVQLLAFSGCAALALTSFRREPTVEHALVPGAFVAWALSKYTFLLIDVSKDNDLLPFVFAWRFAAIALLLVALRPFRSPHGPPKALVALSRGGPE